MLRPREFDKSWRFIKPTQPRVDEVLPRRMRALRVSGEHADCKFVNQSRNVKITGHKLILAVASKYFERLFFSDTSAKVKNGVIKVPSSVDDVFKDATYTIPSDVQDGVFKVVLDYMYTAILPEALVESSGFEFSLCAVDMWYLACLFDLADLNKHVGNKIKVNSKNCLYLYNKIRRLKYYGKMIELDEMEDKCFEVLMVKTDEVLASDAFLQVKPCNLELLFKHDAMNIKSELVLFLAFDKYATKHGWSASGTFYSEKDIPAESAVKIEVLRRVVKYIRFLTMSLEDFEIVAKSGRLTIEEVDSIRTSIRDKVRPNQLPATLTSSLEKRYKDLEIISYSMVSGTRNQATEIANIKIQCNGSLLSVSKTFILMGIRWKIVSLQTGTYSSIQVYLNSDGCEDDNNADWKCHAQVDIQYQNYYNNIPWFCFQKEYNYHTTKKPLECAGWNAISLKVEASLRRPTYSENCDVKIKYDLKAGNMRQRQRESDDDEML